MKALEEKIKTVGKVLPGNILKVGNFLNQQLDVDFLMEMGAEINRLFKDEGVTKILTIEASGIPIAVTAAAQMHVPAVFAKKHKSANLSNDVYRTTIMSYTHGNEYEAVVAKEYLSKDDKVLVVDDFLAHGNALKGMMDIITQAGATFVGAAIAIEKAFQLAGDELRSEGHRVESLAIVEKMTDDGDIFFREQN